MRKTTVILGSLAMLLGGITGSHAEAAEAGDLAFKQSCSRCHRSAAGMAKDIPGATPQARADWLRALLARHHTPDPAVREVLATYLSTLTPN